MNKSKEKGVLKDEYDHSIHQGSLIDMEEITVGV